LERGPNPVCIGQILQMMLENFFFAKYSSLC
jgi:hypothetical protein